MTNSPNFLKPVPPPRLNVFIGSGGVEWTKVRIPVRFNIHDERVLVSTVTNQLDGQHP